MNLEEFKSLVSEVQTTEESNGSEASRLAAAVSSIIELCAPTIRRMQSDNIVVNNEDGEETLAPAGIKFAGDIERNFRNNAGYSSYKWRLSGHSYYITAQGEVSHIAWSGLENEFAGCEGYEDQLTGQVTVTSLADHLEYAPESAQEIIDALFKAVRRDTRAAKDRQTKIAAVIVSLRPPMQELASL